MSPKSPSPVLDSFVKCLRSEMKVTADTTRTKHIKVPKVETASFRDDIQAHLKENFGMMQANAMLDLIDKHFREFMKRQNRMKRLGINAGIKSLGVDPSTDKGRKWWLLGMGCTDESEPVILSNTVSFEAAGDSHLYFENFKTCLNEQLIKGSKKKKARKTKKGKKGQKGKTGKKGKGKTRRTRKKK